MEQYDTCFFGQKDGKLIISRLHDEALHTLQPLFEEVFKHSVSLALLRWKYAERRGESWVVTDESGQIMMHCGLNFRAVLVGGKTVQVAQLIDLMAPKKIKGLSRLDSPFTRLMHQILSDLPRPDNTAGIAFGFPSDRAMRLGEHMGVYREVDRLMELEFEPLISPGNLLNWRELLHIKAADENMINKLWAGMAQDFSSFSIGIRNANYLQHRYLTHPDKRYTLLIIEKKGFWRNVPIGLAVVGPGDERRELLDIVCASEHIQAVIQTTQCWLSKNGGKSLQFLITERFARRLESFAKHCTFTQFKIMGNPFSPDTSTACLEKRWWLTGGDTDYR